MSGTPLFLSDPELEFEKTSGWRGVSLGEDPKVWPSVILKEAFRQVPFLSDYDVDVVLDRQEDDRGYALGHLAVRNKSETPVMAGMDNKPLADLVNKEAKIPVIVKEGQMNPLRVIADGDGFEPLTEVRLGTTLFRADMADMVGKGPGDTSLVDHLYPPTTSRFGGGSVTKAASVLEQLAPVMSKEARDRVLHMVDGDPALLVQIGRNGSFADALDKISNAEPMTAEQARDTVEAHMRPDVVQIIKGTGYYRVKTASATSWGHAVESNIPRAELVSTWGGHIADRVDEEGMITAGRSFVPQGDSVELEPATEYGRFKVKLASGAWSEGWVFPHVVDLDMNLTDQVIYTDGLNAAVVEKVAGIPSAGHMFPAGHGVSGRGFFAATGHDKAVATIPLTVAHAVRDAGDGYYQASTDLGEQVKLSMVHGIKQITKIAEGHYGIPGDMEFIRIRGPVSLAKGREVDEARKVAGKVTVRSDRTCYSLDGHPLDKVASEQRELVGRDDAELLLVAMGSHPTRARAKLAEADMSGQATIYDMRELVSHEESAKRALRESGHMEKAAAMMEVVPRVDLVKEAAVIEDENTVDAVLALNFLTPSNVTLFMDNIPAFEKAASHLAELVVASQLGLNNVDEGAAHKAMTGIDAVITGLRSLEHNEALR
jgi:hypothetical protein